MGRAKRTNVSLSQETVTIYQTVATELGITTTHGGGPPRPAIGKLLTLLAGSLEDGTFDLSAYTVTPAQLTLVGNSQE